MAEKKKPRALATQAAAKIPKMARDNMAATVKAKKKEESGLRLHCCGQDEIIRAMDIVPAWGENFAGSAVQSGTPRGLSKRRKRITSPGRCAPTPPAP